MRRVRARIVGAVDGDGQSRLVDFVWVLHVCVFAPEGIEIHGDTGSRELTDPAEKGGQAVGGLVVERNRPVVTAVQDLVDEAGEDVRGPDFDEGARAAVVHRLDHLDEANRLGELSAELDPHRGAVGRVGLCGLVGIYGNEWGVERDLTEEVGERRARRADHIGMERGGHGEASCREAFVAEERFDALDGRRSARQHDLGVTVVVGDDHAEAGLFDEGSYLFDRPADGGHRPGGLSGLGHEVAAALRDADHVGCGQHPCRVEGGDLAETVPAEVGRFEPDRTQHAQHAETGRADGRLRPLRRGQQRLVRAVGAVLERGDREHDVLHRHVVSAVVGGKVPCSHRCAEVHRQRCSHVRVLAALAGEHEGEIAGVRPRAVVHAGRRRERGCRVVLEMLDCLCQLGQQVGFVPRDDGQPRGRSAAVRALARLCQPGQVTVDRSGARVHPRLPDDVAAVGSGEHHEFDVVGSQARGAHAVAHVLREGDVEVRAAETERTHRSASLVTGSTNPGAGSGVEVER